MIIGSFDCDIDFYLKNNILPIVEDSRDLGVIIDNNLNFTKHINSIVSRAFSRANLAICCISVFVA